MGNLVCSRKKKEKCSYESASVFTQLQAKYAGTNYYLPRELEPQGWRQSGGWQESRTQAATRSETYSVRTVDLLSQDRKAINEYKELIVEVFQCPETRVVQSGGWQQSQTQATTRNERHSVRTVDSFSQDRKASNDSTSLITEVLRCPETREVQIGGWQQSRTQAATQNERHSVRKVDSSSQGRKASNHYTGLIAAVLRCPETRDWATADYNIQTVRLVQVLSISNEYQVVSRQFRTTNKKWYKITRIDRIQNPYLMCAFLLKQEQLKIRLGYPPEVVDVFHGTKLVSVQSICENNFDWRRHGEHVGARYGKGVSFSPISHYATYYSDDEKEGKVMLLVKVLIGRKCLGQPRMTLPLPGFDTTEKDNGHVIVKYEDNDFYPAYKITYDFTGNFNPKSKPKGHVNMNINHNF